MVRFTAIVIGMGMLCLYGQKPFADMTNVDNLACLFGGLFLIGAYAPEVKVYWRENAGFRFFNGASLVALDTENWSLHFGVRYSHWEWGKPRPTWVPMEYVGLGPVFLLCADPEWWYGK